MLELWKISNRFFFIDFLNLKFYMAHPVLKVVEAEKKMYNSR